MARGAKLSWLMAAIALQAVTYLAQGAIWSTIGRMTGKRLPLALVYKLALAKLFVDQALPSAGISGTVVVAQALKKSALPRDAIRAGVVVNTTSFFIAYAVALSAAMIVLFFFGEASWVVGVPCVIFVLLSLGLVFVMLKVSARKPPRRPRWLLRYRIVKNALKVARDADSRLVCSPYLQFIASCYQLVTFLLDAATLWLLIRSLGGAATPVHVFASYMVSNLVRTVSFVPGGLGTFEAAAVWMLRKDRVSIAVGLSALLLFRGITFFLPMIPGLWFSRDLTRHPRRGIT